MPRDPESRAAEDVELPGIVPRRREIKIPLHNRTPAGVQACIRRHPLGFETLHPDRWINNVYFDTPSLACFYTSVAGVDRRLKLRLRWYGDCDDVREGQLEWKWRLGIAGWKWTLPVFWEDDLGKLGWTRLRERLRPELDGRQRATFDALAIPTLLNRYRRSYFVSRDGRCRLTHDTQLSFVPQSGGLGLQRHGGVSCWRTEVLEIKVDLARADAARRALAGFPYRPARFSKYTTGLELFPGAGG
jgi:hypothetical protein